MPRLFDAGSPSALARTWLPLAACLALAAAPAAANPFLSGAGGDGAAPALASPRSAGPAVGLQGELRETLAGSIRSLAGESSAKELATLLGAAFLYGLLHAAGPGHRKTVVFSLFLGRSAKPWEPLAAGFLSSGVHAATGVVIVLALSLLRGAVAGLGDAERLGAWLDAGTFGFMGLLALTLFAAKLARLRRGKSGLKGSREPSSRAGVEDARGGRGLYGAVSAASLVPCPGAVMLLLFALYAGRPDLGVAGVLSMSLGMGLVVSAAGYLAFAGRQGLFSRLKSRERLVGLVADGLELLSYLLIAAFAAAALLPMLR